jgi:putative tributyrin esterase
MSSISLSFYADSLHFRTDVRVVLPEYRGQRDGSVARSIAFDASTRFPVVYLLHGYTGDYSDWTNCIPIERFAAQFGFAIVMPKGYNTWYLNVPDGLQMEDMIADELPAAMEAMLPISSDPRKRFIAGLSMGGTGAMRVAYKYPERYRAAAALSALLDCSLPLGEPAENVAYEEQLRRDIVHCHGGVEELESPDKNILKLAARAVADGKTLPPLRFEYGEQDPRFDIQYPMFKQFAEDHSLSVTFHAEPGRHDFDFWEPAIQRSLAWFRKLCE